MIRPNPFLVVCLSACCLLLLLPAARAKTPPKQAKLHGILKQFNNAVELGDMSELEYLLPRSAGHIFTPGENGAFSLTISLAAPAYFRLGRNILYLSPGDDLEMVIDQADNKLGTFSGTGSAANNYLKYTLYPKAGSFLDGGGLLRKYPSPSATLDAIQQGAAKRQQSLEALNDVSPEFKRLETARIRADIFCSCKAVFDYEPYMNRNQDSVRLFTETFGKIAAPLLEKCSKDFLDPSFLQVEVYRNIVSQLPGLDVPSPEAATIRDWLKASQLVEEMQQAHDKPGLKVYRGRIDSLQTALYKNALERSLTSLLAFGNGDKAVDFTALDQQGKRVSLSSLRGKVIFVDIWATWCGPCMAEMPHFEELKTKYKDNPSVVFVSLSIDDAQDQWRKNIQQRKAEGLQWLIDRNKMAAYNIVGIPRTLLIDKDFKVVDLSAPMPSSPAAASAIDKLL